MKAQQIKSTLTVLALAAMVFAGCRKEKITPLISDPTTSENNSNDVNMMADEANAVYMQSTIIDGTQTAPFAAKNDGLSEDYLTTTADLDATNDDQTSLVRCLKGLKLTDEQIAKLRRAFSAYEDCKAISIKNHREAYAALVAKVEAARQDLLKQLKNNEITKEEFEKAIKSLRQRFEHALAEIKRSFAKDLKECHRKFLAHIKEILTERQWAAFVKCHKH